jgi:hypothetical protein
VFGAGSARAQDHALGGAGAAAQQEVAALEHGSRLNSSVYFFLCFAIFRTPGAYWLHLVSGKPDQLHLSIAIPVDTAA